MGKSSRAAREPELPGDNLAGKGSDLEDSLARELWSWVESAYHQGSHHTATRGRLTPELDEALKALGYIE